MLSYGSIRVLCGGFRFQDFQFAGVESRFPRVFRGLWIGYEGIELGLQGFGIAET